MINKISVHDSSGNVFADIGIENPEEYLAKAELAARILRIVQSRRLTQAAAGKILGITQPNVSALLNGRLDGFSTDRLFRFLNNLGCDVQIKISKARPHGHGRVLVTAA
jgi:predicted XRE-type DNA-binding protein